MTDTPKITMTDGSPVYEGHKELQPNGQQKGHIVLSAEERAKGFVRPVRYEYVHIKCGVVTTMTQAIAETYARNPHFYSGMFCCGCGKYFPIGPAGIGEFWWTGTTDYVGT